MAKQVINITVRFNMEHGGIEVVNNSWDALTEGDRAKYKEMMKKHGFTYHGKNRYHYARYTEEKMAWVREVFPKSCAKLAEKDEEAVKQTSAQAQAARPKKEKKQSTADRLDRLEELMTQFLLAQQNKH